MVLLPGLLVPPSKCSLDLFLTARIEVAHSDCAASASKKNGLAAPLPPFQARLPISPQGSLVDLDCARRTSTVVSCAFREQEGDQAARSFFRL